MRNETPSNKPFIPDPSSIEISDEKYHELRKLSIEMVEDTIIGKVKEMAPVLFVHFRKLQEGGMIGDLEHAIVVIADGFRETESKYKTIFTIGQRFEEEKMIPAAVFMGSEAWTSRNPKAGVMPSQDPDRKEVIVLSGVSIGRECRSITMIPIKHDADGKIIRDGEEEKYPEGAQIESPLLDQFFHGFFATAKERNEQNDNRYKR